MVLVTKSKPRKSAHTQWRQGTHHKKDERYLRHYWPYIPLLLIVVAGLVFSNVWGSGGKGVLSYATDMSVSGLLNGTNTQRTAYSLGSLALNSKLNQAAQAKANDMAARNYWSHNTPDGATPWTFFVAAGYNYQTAGENLAYGFDNSDYTISGWMNSPGHKANILGDYTEVGFGVANSPDFHGTGPETIVVAMYGKPQAVASAPTPTPAATKPTAQPAAKPTTTPTPETPAPTTVAETPAQEPAKQPETNKTQSTPAGAAPSATPKTVTAQNVSRIQLLTNGKAAWSTFVITVFAAVCLGVFILRHGLFWHRTLIKGQKFIMNHKLLDLILVATAVIGFVLTRSAGVIH